VSEPRGDAAFRAEVATWFAEHAPAKGSAEDFSTIHIVSAKTSEEFEARESHAMDVTRAWQRKLHSAGWAGRSWPEEYGGYGAPDWHTHAIAEEQTRYGVSTKMLAIALEMVPPVLLEHGTDEQCRVHLPVIVRGDEAWCQLLSEPDAGSDLGNVQTLATTADGGWNVSGQKVWTSGAVSADYALLLARTDRSEPGRAGVSFFALDMRQAGVTVRPLRQMSGGYHFNEVFLDDAFVPESALIGALGGGFAVLRTMLASERAAIGGGTSARSAAQLRTMAEETGRAGEPTVRQEVVRAHTREWLLDLVMARAASIPAGGPVTKLLYSEHARLSANAALEILGASSLIADDSLSEPWLERFLFAPGLRLGGGTDEIQRNTIAERGLGLPREPRST
jgi:alkylation response protein AidB-like acyl-CoA dehydrogenase